MGNNPTGSRDPQEAVREVVCVFKNHPVTTPSRLLVEGRVPWPAPVPLSGASKSAKVSLGKRVKPCQALLASI
jgi:hypothetical protein